MTIDTASVLGPPIQIAYAVPDVRAAAERWARDFDAGPFLVRSTTGLTDVTYRGELSSFDHTSAYGQWGSLMVELVEDHQDDRTVIRDMFGLSESGLHHLAFAVESIEEATTFLEESGHGMVMSAVTNGGTEFRFFDAIKSCGHMLEIYERSERLTSFYEAVRLASANWDGVNPFMV